MTPLYLPSVTLVMLDCTCPELATLALQDTLKAIRPAKAYVFSDTEIKVYGVEYVKVKPWGTIQEFCEFLWYRVECWAPTSHILTIQWDGWVLDAEMWDPAYLQYDFVGAPWWYSDTHNVGNGTGLRSTKLMRFLERHRKVLPVYGKEDELLGRVYRPILEYQGFKWAPEQLASKFSLETTRPSVDSRHF